MILEDSESSIHLKIAALESIANSSGSLGLESVLRDIVFEKHDNRWLRTSALKAFSKSVQNDLKKMRAIDHKLSRATDDVTAPQIRVDLLYLTLESGKLSHRILSILDQAAKVRHQDSTFGIFYQLSSLPSGTELLDCLDGAAKLLSTQGKSFYELQVIYSDWLQRRLTDPSPISPTKLAKWLRANLGEFEDRHSEAITALLKSRFKMEPDLFEGVFKQLIRGIPKRKNEFSFFLFDDLWKLLPAIVWPTPPSTFLLKQAEKQKETDKTVSLFNAYLDRFPNEGPLELAEAGLAFLARRTDVAGNSELRTIYQIPKWKIEQNQRKEEERQKLEGYRSQNIAYLSARLSTIREGKEEHALVWAYKHYVGHIRETRGSSDPRERLLAATDRGCTDALIQGFFNYAGMESSPKKDELIESWITGKIPDKHRLFCLSLFMRIDAGVTLPAESLPHCIVAVALRFHAGVQIDRYKITLLKWFLEQACENRDTIESALTELWIISASKRKSVLPGFYELRDNSGSHAMLAAISAKVLQAKVDIDTPKLYDLISILIFADNRSAISIGKTKLKQRHLPVAHRAIWTTALFLIDHSQFSASWKRLMTTETAELWEAIEFFRHCQIEITTGFRASAVQRSEIVRTLGKRFPNVDRPCHVTVGNQNPWDAAQFIANQIKLLAADGSHDTGGYLENLENDPHLHSYKDLVRHHREEYLKQQRETTFSFASPRLIANALRNLSPANSNDLLVYIVDHLKAIGRDIARTETEKYRAYWNEDSQGLSKPKKEETCSGFLAEDLQSRVRPQNLVITIEHHMVNDKECDIVVLQGIERLLPIEVKHHYNRDLWKAWKTQLDKLYATHSKAAGLGIYLVLWSGEGEKRKLPRLPKGLIRPQDAMGLQKALESIMPENDRFRLRIVVIDISGR